MSVATFSRSTVEVYKTTNHQKETLYYFLKLLPYQNKSREFTFEYKNGKLELSEGDATTWEEEFLVHYIQLMEMSNEFHY